MEENSFRTIRDALDALQHSGSLNAALAEILEKYGSELTMEQKIQLADIVAQSERAKKILEEKIVWENDWF